MKIQSVGVKLFHAEGKRDKQMWQLLFQISWMCLKKMWN